MLANHHKRKDDPDEDQHYVQDEERLRREGQNLNSDKDGKGRDPVAHAPTDAARGAAPWSEPVQGREEETTRAPAHPEASP